MHNPNHLIMNGEELKKYRESFNITQDELAKLIGVTRKTINTYENSSEIPISKQKLFASIFDEVGNKKLHVKSHSKTENDLREIKLGSKSAYFKSVPFYNINVSAGDVVFLDDGLLENKEPDDLMFIPKNIDADIAFPTYGHSMYPEISNGDRVAYKVIKDWSFFNYGMKYLIITDEQRMVKYLKKHTKEGFVLLESRNKDFESIDMPISSIRAILQVRYIGKIEM